MATFIAFLRAVNVGGRKVPMADLRDELEANGFTDVETYIESGNLRVTTSVRSAAQGRGRARAADAGLARLRHTHDRADPSPADRGVRRRSTADEPAAGTTRHYVSFLKDAPSAAAAKKLEAWDKPQERAQVVGREVHLWLGGDRPKLNNAHMEKLLGTVGTARDWKTLVRLKDAWT